MIEQGQKKKSILNKHFMISLGIFLFAIFFVSLFISFLKDTVKNDISLKWKTPNISRESNLKAQIK